jgi:hypothetical protein
MNNMTLYDLSTELHQLENILEDAQGDVPEIALEAQNRLLELIQSKTDACVGYAMSLEDYAGLIASKIKTMQTLLATVEKKQARYDDYVKSCLTLLGVKKISGKMNTISLRQPSKIVEIYDESLLPQEYFKRVESVTVSKQQIKDDLKAGKEIQGAKLSDGKESVNYKVGK